MTDASRVITPGSESQCDDSRRLAQRKRKTIACRIDEIKMRAELDSDSSKSSRPVAGKTR